MNTENMAENIVKDMERVNPYMYEGLYGSFLRNYMGSDKSKWTDDLSRFLTNVNNDWSVLSKDIAAVLWERFERRISC